MAHKEMKEMLRAAAILSVASLLTKVLSAFYRVPYQNLVGDEGFYVYQQVYPLYGLAMTFSLSGLPLFLSKILQETDDLKEKQELLHQLYPLIQRICFVIFGGLYLFSPFLAKQMGDEQLSPLIKVAACIYLLSPPLAFYRGYFQGIPWMTPTALSQLGEQTLRVIVIVLGAFLFKPLQLSVYQVAFIGYLGAVLGGALALVILLKENKRATFFYIRPKDFLWLKKKEPVTSNHHTLMKRLSMEGSLIFIYSSLLIFYQLVDSFVMKDALVASGLSNLEAKVQKGIFDRGQPLVQLGLVVALGLTSIFLPMLTRQVRHQKKAAFQAYSGMFIRLTSALAGGATVGLIFLLPAVNFTLFKDQKGLLPLSLFVLSIFLVAMIQVYENILQSQNQYQLPLKSALLGLLVKILTTHLFVLKLQTTGSSLATLLGLSVTLFCLKRQEDDGLKKQLYHQMFLPKLLLSLGIMGLGLTIYQVLLAPYLLQHRLSALLFSIGGVIFGGGIFLVTSLKLRLLTVREWLLLPSGEKILRLFKKK